MMYTKRSDDAIKTELEYIQEYVQRIFGKELEKEFLQNQLDEIVTQKITDYIFQRYRDWTAPEIIRLRDCWETKVKLVEHEPALEAPQRRRGRPSKSDQSSPN